MEEARTRSRYKWLIITVAVVVGGWSVAWYGSSYYAGQAVDRWIAREASLGRKWSCKERTIGGYPFRMAIACRDLRFTGLLRGKTAQISLGQFRAIAQIYNPRLVIVEADGPFQAKAVGRLQLVDANWSLLRASVRLTRPLPERLSVRIVDLKANIVPPGAPTQGVAAKSAEFHLRPAPDVTGDIGAIDLALVVQALETAVADKVTGAKGPADANIAARVTRAGLLFAGPRSSRLENWRRANGRLTLQKSFVRKGQIRVEANGALHIDSDRRLAGTINARAAGLGGLLARLGLGLGARKNPTAASLIAKGLSRFKRRSAAANPKPPRFVPLPLLLRDGRVWFGPIRTPVRLKPLY